MKKLVSTYAWIAGCCIVYRAILKDLWAHIAHEDFYLGAACMAGGYCVVQLLVFTITGNWIGG